MTLAILDRLRAMDGAELRFRARTLVRNRMARARAVLAPQTWRRESLRLSSVAPREASDALRRRDWMRAHRSLAAHFASRAPLFPLDPRRLPELASLVRARFPDTPAITRANRILTGTYTLLGYENLQISSPPDWQWDPVHERRPPSAYWDSVPYLDPACGDHKIIWELNRHQHFLPLGAAHALTGDVRYYREFVSQLSDWIRRNPPLAGINWASMLELAFRCLSWIWALHFFAGSASGDDEEPWTVDLLLALDRQLAHVEQNLSRYFSPNTHLTGEALALFVAGRAFPELVSAPRFTGLGRDILIEQSHRQVLPDGGHAERSAHYHRYSTDFYLLAYSVARLTRDRAEATLEACARRQARFLAALADSRGRLPLLGDDDGGQLFSVTGAVPDNAGASLASAAVLLEDGSLAVGPAPEDTWWFCGGRARVDATLTIRDSAAFHDTGYYICRDSRGDHLVFDAGPHGYLNGGHAHADALSVVVTAAGRPLLVDPGTATYTMAPATRDRFRSTAMHNTVVVDGRSQSIPGGPFHWQSRTDAACTAWRPGRTCDYVEGRHSGYAPVIHVRSIAVIHGIGWIIVDHLIGGLAAVSGTAMWHVHPDWRVDSTDAAAVRLSHVDAGRVSLASSAALREVTTSGLDEFAPIYGRVTRGLCFSADFGAHPPRSLCTFLSAQELPAVRISAIEIDGEGCGTHQAGFRIDTSSESLIVLASAVCGQDDSARPRAGQRWGSGELQTTARFAVFRATGSGPLELCAIPFDVASPVQVQEDRMNWNDLPNSRTQSLTDPRT